MWLLDTGCPVDLVQTNSLTRDQLEMRERAEHPVALETANDRVEADQIVPMQVDGIRENIDPLCLVATPSVLNIGRRCRLHGFGFYWRPYNDTPEFVDPKGKLIPVETHDDVPYYRDTYNKQVKAKFRGPPCGAVISSTAAPAVDEHLVKGGGDAMEIKEFSGANDELPEDDQPAREGEDLLKACGLLHL